MVHYIPYVIKRCSEGDLVLNLSFSLERKSPSLQLTPWMYRIEEIRVADCPPIRNLMTVDEDNVHT